MASVVRIVYLQRQYSTDNQILTDWTIVLCAQVVQDLGIITACIPYLKPFWESIQSGMIRSDDVRRRGGTGMPRIGNLTSFELSNLSSQDKRRNLGSKSQLNVFPPSTAEVVVTSGGQVQTQEWDAESQKSSSKIIKTTRTWAVDRPQ